MIGAIIQKVKGYRTVAFNALALAPVIFDTAMAVLIDPDFGQLVPQDWYPVYLKVVLVVNLWLRYVTTTPIGGK